MEPLTPATNPTMTNAEFQKLLKRLGACREGVAWVGRRDLATAWTECERPDWLMWLAGALKIDPSVSARVAVACAQTALQYVPAGEDRPRLAIEAAIRCVENPTEENRRAAAYAARASYAAADAADAAYAAAYAARAADAAADAAARASYAAYAAAQRQMVAIIREHISLDMIERAAQLEATDGNE